MDKERQRERDQGLDKETSCKKLRQEGEIRKADRDGSSTFLPLLRYEAAAGR